MGSGKTSSLAVSRKRGGGDGGTFNPVTTTYEFMGPPGAFAVIIGCTFICFLWYLACNPVTGCSLPVTSAHWTAIASGFRSLPSVVYDPFVFLCYVGWFAWFVLLWHVMPGKSISGTPLRDGRRLMYLINGLNSLIVTVGLGFYVAWRYGSEPFIWVADHYIQFVFASWAFATGLAVFVYLYSFRSADVMLALGGNSGNVIYDFFIGRELNPRIGSFDIKYFCELRPGIIGWALLDICFAVKQYSEYGHVTNSMWLAILPQLLYAVDALWFESAVITTMDITTDGFGWMLGFGDLCWVPSIYSLQARFLSSCPVQHSALFTALVATLAVVSFLTFRLSNSEKNAFRADPNHPSVRHLEYIETEAGSKLLVSGWWGMARHINYTGDWFFGLAQCLATGFETPMTYFFAAYFLVLLLHRNNRDEHKCRQKYKKDWDRYCERVPYQFIPFIY